MKGICIEFTGEGMTMGLQCNAEEVVSAIVHLIKEITKDGDLDQVEVLGLIATGVAELNFMEKEIKNRRRK